MRRLVLLMSLALSTNATAASLKINTVSGPIDQAAGGTVTIDAADGARTPVQFRLAQNFADLPHASWRAITGQSVVTVSWIFPGYALGIDKIVVAEIDYADSNPNVIVSAAEHARPAHLVDAPV